jgi:hypothetical protein
MPIQLANNASGTIATAISASDTGLALTTGDGAAFPVLGLGDYFYATITSSGGTQEIVKATARSGDSLTIVRAQESTVAQSFAAGSRFELRVTAQSIIDTAQQYAADADISLRNDLAAATGSSLVGFQQAGSSTVLRTAQAKLRETVSVKDFGAVGDGVTDDTAAIQAALDASKSVYFPEGIYALADQIVLNTAQKLTGDGYASVLLSTGTNKHIVYGNNVDNIEIDSLFFKGNATGTGVAGHGIRLLNAEYINIHDCYFDTIGNVTGFAGCISGEFCEKVIVDSCIFLGNGGGSVTGADIGFGYYGKYCNITNNISYSNHDAMISLAAVGVAKEDTTNHVVANNVGIRRDTNTSRSGIIITYNDKAAYTTITGNILYNWVWNGIYIQSATSNVAESAGFTIQGNIVRYCGGENSSIGSGIYLSGNNGLTCTGNLVEYTGYNSSGVARGAANNGINVQNSATNISVTGNVVRRSKGSGISFQPLSGYQQIDIAVSGNVFDDNEGAGVFILPSNTGTLKNLIISNNVIKNETFDVDGINITLIGSAVAPENLLIEGNIISAFSGSTRSGIRTTAGTPNAWVIRGNLIDTFDKGFECATFPADQIYGTQCILDGNTIKNCTTGYSIGSGGAAFNGYVFNPIYINVTTKHASANYCDAVNIGNGNIELRRSAAPSAGTWRVGDRVTFLAPSAGGNIGAVCVTAGAPGTWKTFGGIAP